MSKLLPYCDSLRCAGMRIKAVVKFNIVPKTSNCPDCGSALLWKKDKTYLSRATKSTKSKDRENYGLAITRKEMVDYNGQCLSGNTKSNRCD